MTVKNDQELSDLAALAFDGSRLLFFQFLVQLKFLVCLRRLSRSLVGYTQAIMCFAEPRVYFNGFGIEVDSLRVIVLNEIEDPKLEIGFGKVGV